MLKLLKLVQIHVVAFVAFVDSSLNSDLQRNICLFRLQKKLIWAPFRPLGLMADASDSDQDKMETTHCDSVRPAFSFGTFDIF